MSHTTKLPILEVATLLVVVFASVMAVVPGAEEYAMKVIGQEQRAKTDALHSSSLRSESDPRPGTRVENPLPMRAARIQPVSVQKRSATVHSNKREKRPSSQFNKNNSADSDENLLSADLAVETSSANRNSMDPFAELDRLDLEDSLDNAELVENESVIVDSGENTSTVSKDASDWELELEPQTSPDEQGQSAAEATAPARRPQTETSTQESSDVNSRGFASKSLPGLRGNVSNPDDLQLSVNSPAWEPSVTSLEPAKSIGPARLLKPNPSGVFKKFDVERGQVIVNRTYDGDADLGLAQSTQGGQTVQNSMARIVIDPQAGASQRNPTIGADFDWNEFICQDLPRPGSAGPRVQTPTLRRDRHANIATENFRKLPPITGNPRLKSVLNSQSGQSPADRISRQPMTSPAMLRDNSFRPVR